MERTIGHRRHQRSVTLTDEHYVVDVANLPWRPGVTEGVVFRGQILLSGDDGGPEAFRFRFEPCRAVHAHMHLVSQFQLLIGGEMELPGGSPILTPTGVFYTDHARPYGPFAVRGDHDVLVLHPRKGGLVQMSDRSARRKIHLEGRQRAGVESQTESTHLPHLANANGKVLFDVPAGPKAVVATLEPGAEYRPPAAPFGRYEVVLGGSMHFGALEVGRPGLRYTRSAEPPSSSRAGDAGASLALLTFDEDALLGGVSDDEFSLAAGEAMARAI